MIWHCVGTVDEFTIDRGVKVNVDGIEIAVFRTDSGWYAISNRCPHKNAPLHLAGSPAITEDDDPDTRGGIDPDGPTIQCPWHTLEFELEIGYNMLSGWCVRTFSVSVEGDQVNIRV